MLKKLAKEFVPGLDEEALGVYNISRSEVSENGKRQVFRNEPRNELLPNRLVVGQRTLDPYARVQILPRQPNLPSWSRGLGRRPLTAKITGSNPVLGTKEPV